MVCKRMKRTEIGCHINADIPIQTDLYLGIAICVNITVTMSKFKATNKPDL